MGSIRPLITIAILAVVGAYLYVKINEGPAPSRAAANALSQVPDGVPPLTGTKGTSLAADTAAPAWPSTAPALAASPAATTSTTPPTAATALAKDGLPAVPAIPELPPLPAINDPAPPATQTSPPLPTICPRTSRTARHPAKTRMRSRQLQPAPLSATDPRQDDSADQRTSSVDHAADIDASRNIASRSASCLIAGRSAGSRSACRTADSVVGAKSTANAHRPRRLPPMIATAPRTAAALHQLRQPHSNNSNRCNRSNILRRQLACDSVRSRSPRFETSPSAAVQMARQRNTQPDRIRKKWKHCSANWPAR